MTGAAGIEAAVRRLLHEALDRCRNDPGVAGPLRHQLARLDRPVRVAVVGPWRCGKSTLLNALMGEVVAPVGEVAGGDAFVWYEDGPTPRATAWSADRPPQELAVARSASGMRVGLGGPAANGLTDVVVRWPTRSLRHLTLLDTPAFGADEPGPVVERVLNEADAVLHLTRDGRHGDLRLLEAGRESLVGQAAPVPVVLVRSRADEIGGGQIDALLTARQLARRQQRDPRVAARCWHVVACSGAVGLAGRTLAEPEFAALAELARVPRPELAGHLLSADRFLRGELPVYLDTADRAALVDRLGLFGVRLATTLVRTGCDTRAKLAAELVRRSGLAELRESVHRLFVDRQGVLKARSALATVEAVARTRPAADGRALLGAVERVLAGAHEFAELRLFAALHGDRSGFDAGTVEEARRLLGGEGSSLPARLGVEFDAPVRRLWEAATEAQRRWRERAEDPRLRLGQRRGAQVVARSCEGMLAELVDRSRRPAPA
ncbi:hypothetical protein [Micromonospora sp. KC721]|uniref:hypothetical protein n=1 Tax=Micromonospora sp. KC721 TaxID=2530380 RepID=UPI00104F4BFF|nr:hypothetical protein [Micromonospora sp. KC721]TDB71785.1 hypothetical protein E1182_24395 [Micromonospora sp. KC721]